MAKKIASRTAQYPLHADFFFNFDDTALDSVSGGLKTFGAVFGDQIVFDAIPLPQGAVIFGGALIVATAGVGPTAYTAALGTAASPAGILAATSLLAAGYTEVTGKGLISNDGSNVRLTIASTVANATAGKFRVRIHYTIDNRTNEVQIT
jgi:hypothetical protein